MNGRVIGQILTLLAIIAAFFIILVANQYGIFPADVASSLTLLVIAALAIYAFFVFFS